MDERILDGDCSESRILFEIARDEMDARRYEDAIRFFQHSNSLEPNYKTCLLLGDCLLRLGRHQDSIIPLAAATALNRQGIAPTLLAEAYLALNDSGRAKVYVELALERQPHYKRAQKLLPTALEAFEARNRDLTGDDPA
jgi:tetratricopeptide (TPR) repeat protein